MAITRDPDHAAATLLDADGGISLTLGTNLFMGPVRAHDAGLNVPHEAVFCLTTGGPPPSSHIEGSGGSDIRIAAVQVRVRSNVGDFSGGQTLAAGCFDALQRGDLSAYGYIGVTAQTSHPIYLGQDDTEHHEWSLNVQLMYED